ncbi:hypothetical protein [Kitasatospora sp. NPDC057015]|uniref:hypothetical protein n=1 Tax=Kitasatospora sp. NPDC057015 TaxID=3346001 RepID=UPI003639A7B6
MLGLFRRSIQPGRGGAEFLAHGFGEHGLTLAGRLADAVRAWDRHARGRGYPELTIHPAATPVEDLPAGHVLDKASSRLVFRWPGGDAAPGLAVMAVSEVE